MKLLFIIGLALLACTSPAANDRPGSAAVYARIAALTDCPALQKEFDTADASHKRETAGSAQSEVALSYMKAADARMRELKCY